MYRVYVRIGLVTGALCLFSFGGSSEALRLSLGERGMVQHLKLLSQSPLFGSHAGHAQAFTLKEQFLLKDYASYAQGFAEAYPSPNLADSEMLYSAILRHYQLGHWAEVHRLLPFLDARKLRSEQQINLSLFQAVDYYRQGQFQTLDKMSMEEGSAAIQELRDALYLKQSGAVKFSVGDPYLTALLGWNNLVTGNYDAALDHFSKAGLVSSDVWVSYARALKSLKAGQYEYS
ncbi:MAG: hypothetical protein AABZ14_05630, partial [Candidatus Margulisiibacteriota bacterium]